MVKYVRFGCLFQVHRKIFLMILGIEIASDQRWCAENKAHSFVTIVSFVIFKLFESEADAFRIP